VARPGTARAVHLAIRPYPGELEERIAFDGRQLLLRPIRPEDEPQHRQLLARISADDIQFRFFHAKREFAHTELARFTQIDYDREMAFIATELNAAGVPETLGVARAVADPDNTSAEFAVLVRSDLKGKGLGRALLDKLIRYCRDRGTRELTGEVLISNTRMLKLTAGLGFKASVMPEDPGIMRATLTLRSSEEGTSTPD
jgi:acetyltransferase